MVDELPSGILTQLRPYQVSLVYYLDISRSATEQLMKISLIDTFLHLYIEVGLPTTVLPVCRIRLTLLCLIPLSFLLSKLIVYVSVKIMALKLGVHVCSPHLT